MSYPTVRIGTLTLSHGELFAHVTTPIPGHLAMKSDGPDVVVPIPAGVGDGAMGDMTSKELRAYLDHGMAFSGHLTLRDAGDGLRLVGANDLKAITDPDPEAREVLNRIASVAEMLAGYRGARVRSGLSVTLEDWQGVEREDKTTPDSIRLTIRAEDKYLLITTEDGRKVDLELQDGALRVLAYEREDGKQAPVITSLPPSGEILTDREDYNRESRPSPEGPDF